MKIYWLSELGFLSVTILTNYLVVLYAIASNTPQYLAIISFVLLMLIIIPAITWARIRSRLIILDRMSTQKWYGLDSDKLKVGDIIATTHSGKIDRKSTRLNSSHQIISYAVFCLKKKIE